MCGILGYFAFNRPVPDAARYASRLSALAHRGPDDAASWTQGPFFFGHRRLSIIDLACGRQPMARPEGDLVVTFNGEIYNYIEIRSELAAKGYRFRTQSDTEVLLHGYREWGTGLPARLVGMFAFAIADLEKQELFLARDPFGEKPLLYTRIDDGVVFASELAPISSLVADRALNLGALPGFLCLNYVTGDETLMRGVRRVRPGSWQLYDRTGEMRTGEFWCPPADESPDGDEAEAVERLESLLRDSVRLALRSDVPVGVLLSGGIDSALIAKFASETGTLAQAFCLTFDEASYSEWDRASVTARELKIPLTRVSMGPGALDRFAEIVAHGDDPLADSSSLALFTLCQAASQHVKVVLSGDGGDELFGGYLTYKATAWHSAVTSRLPRRCRRAVASVGQRFPVGEAKVSRSYKMMRYLRAIDLPPNEAHFTWNGVWLPGEAATLAVDPALAAEVQHALTNLAAAHALPPRPPLEALQRADIAEYLPNDILAKVDRMSMAHGLEVRAPLLNPALAAFALSLPTRFKVTKAGPTKRILRALARQHVSGATARAAKQGFSIPVHAWLRGPARALVADLLAPESIRRLEVLDPRRVEHAVEEHMSGRRALGFELWGLMVLVAWHRRHIEHPVTVPPGPLPPDLAAPKELTT